MKKHGTPLFVYFLVLYLATLPLTGWFALRNDGGSGLFRSFYLVSTWLAFSGIVLLPAVLLAALGFSRKLAKAPLWIARVICILATLFAFVTHLFLLADAIMLVKFGYHINGLVVNLLTTPGGFESMGLEANTLLIAGLGLGLLLVLHCSLMIFCTKSKHSLRLAAHLPVKTMLWTFPLLTGASLLVSMLCTGLADFKLNQDVLGSLEAFPFAPTLRMRHFLRTIGMQGPKRSDLPRFTQKNSKLARVKYPLLPIDRRQQRSHPNIIWLVGESLRADLLSPEIMPFHRALQRRKRHADGHVQHVLRTVRKLLG